MVREWMRSNILHHVNILSTQWPSTHNFLEILVEPCIFPQYLILPNRISKLISLYVFSKYDLLFKNYWMVCMNSIKMKWQIENLWSQYIKHISWLRIILYNFETRQNIFLMKKINCSICFIVEYFEVHWLNFHMLVIILGILCTINIFFYWISATLCLVNVRNQYRKYYIRYQQTTKINSIVHWCNKKFPKQLENTQVMENILQKLEIEECKKLFIQNESLELNTYFCWKMI